MVNKRKPQTITGYFSRPTNEISEIQRNLRYYKGVRDQLQAHQTKHAQIMFRKNLVDSQNKMNYSNELDRIKGELSKTMLNGVTAERLQRRQKELMELGKKIV